MKYPAYLLRGILNEQYITQAGTAATCLISFANNPSRSDAWIELSINWEDDDKAIDFTLKQRRDDGQLKFKAGVAKIPRRSLDNLKLAIPLIENKLAYERDSLPGNNYHGNLLLHKDIPKPIQRQLEGTIAAMVFEIIHQTS